MPSRHKSRERALQILFSWDARKQPVDDAINAYFNTLYAEEHPAPDDFAAALVRGAVEHGADLDQRISRHAEHWRLERMPAVDRNLLRMAVGEMLGFKGTPFPIVINEALEIGRRYSAPESINFLNGMLDAIARGLIGK
jgi:transcription antitermination protein NusB